MAVIDTTTIIQISLESWGAMIAFICCGVAWAGRRSERKRSQALCLLLLLDSLLLVNDVLAYVYRGNVTRLGFYMVRFSNFFVFALVPLLSFGTMVYIVAMVDDEHHMKDVWVRTSAIIGGGYLFLLIASQFSSFIYYFDETNRYHRSPSYLVSVLAGAILLMILLAALFYFRDDLSRAERYSIMTFIFLPFGTNVIQAFYYGLSLNTIAITVSILFLFATHEAEKGERLFKQEKRLMDQEILIANQYRDLAEQQNRITLSQVQPHFMFNVLGSIEQLCKKDPSLAALAIHKFSKYLRKNLNTLSKKSIVPFEEEMDMISAYVWLEKMRFGDELEYLEDVTIKDFRLPSMSVQPIVENAIKHGMRDEDEAVLHITLSTRETKDNYIIQVKDDGIGFDPEKMYEDNRVHIGVDNVKRRLEILCNGKIYIESTIGRGTKISIIIPKKQSDLL